MDDCVETEDLVAMLDGNLAAERVEAVLVHVDQCTVCAEVIANLARDAGRGVGRYQLRRVIGAGGMGVVHEGWDPELRRRVAVKLVRPEHSDDASHARMLREARALARISHPNVVAVYDVGEHAGEIYVATELVDGETMATWCRGRASREVVAAWIQAARGLDGAHAGGIIHRDVKPANVLVGRDGRVRIGDFGLARLGPIAAPPPTAEGTPPARPPRSPTAQAFATVTDAGHIGGTPAYMAPEQWRGITDARSDQYALSVAIVESLTGRRPSDDHAFALPDGTAGGEALARALERGLREDPSARFPSIGALADALEAAIAPPVRRSRIALVAAVAAAALGGGAAIAWRLVVRPGAPCDLAVPDDVWSPDRRAALERRLPRAIPAHIDAWMASWTAAAADSCTVDGGAPEVRARRERCLDDGLDQARKMLARLDANAAYPSLNAQIGIEILPRPAGCSHAAALAEIEPAPAQRFAIAAQRARMEHAVYVTRRDELAIVRDVAAAARALGHAPFIVESAIELARQLARSDRQAAAATLRDAIARADQAGDDRSRAQGAIELLKLLDADRVDEAIAVAEAARAGLPRLGGEPALEDDLDFALAGVLKSAMRWDEAIAALERARRNARDAYGPDSNHEAMALTSLEGAYSGRDPAAPGARPARDAAAEIYRTLGTAMPTTRDAATLPSMIEVLEAAVAQQHKLMPDSENEADAHWALAGAYFLADRLDGAREQHRLAAAIYDRLKVRKSAVVDVHTQVALMLLDDGQLHEALHEADRGAELAEAIAVKSDIGFALTAQGQVRLALGDLAGARAVLRRALAVRMEIRAVPTQLGNTQFQYARALWKVDRRLAVDYATAARVLIRSYVTSEVPELERPHVLPMQQRRLAEVNRWLDDHRR